MKPQPLDLEELKKDMYPKDIFPEITNNEWKKINELLQKELGFPLDRVAGNINRMMWNNMSEWFIERIKSACEFYLRYKDNSELLIKEHPELKSELDKNYENYSMATMKAVFGIYADKVKIVKEEYNEWLFKLAFRGVVKNDH